MWVWLLACDAASCSAWTHLLSEKTVVDNKRRFLRLAPGGGLEEGTIEL